VSKKVKGHGTITVYQEHLAYIPKQVIAELGKKIEYVLDARTVLLFDPETDPDILIQSLDGLKNHINLRRMD
jgi:hypothetical protein